LENNRRVNDAPVCLEEALETSPPDRWKTSATEVKTVAVSTVLSRGHGHRKLLKTGYV